MPYKAKHWGTLFMFALWTCSLVIPLAVPGVGKTDVPAATDNSASGAMISTPSTVSSTNGYTGRCFNVAGQTSEFGDHTKVCTIESDCGCTDDGPACCQKVPFCSLLTPCYHGSTDYDNPTCPPNVAGATKGEGCCFSIKAGGGTCEEQHGIFAYQ